MDAVTPSRPTPPSADLDPLWARHRGATPAARRGLSVDRVVAAAIELVDADGLEGLSMAKVAERLGFATMALYRHVPSRHWLLQLMADEAIGRPPAALDEPSDGWRAGLHAWSWALLETLRAHPWVMEILTTGLPVRPSQLAWLDRGLRALEGTGLSEHDKAELLLVLNGHIFWEARLGHDFQPTDGDAGAQAATALQLVTADEFPALRTALDAGIFDEPSHDRDADFQLGLDVLLDGIGRYIERESGPT